MFWTWLKPMSGSNSPNARRAEVAASRNAWATPKRLDASEGISHFLHVRPTQKTLRQKDHCNGEDGEGGDVFVVRGKVGRPQGFNQADEETAEHGTGQRADAAQHGRCERLHAG